MALADYNHGITAGKVKARKNTLNDSYISTVDGKVVCSMSSGGAHYFRTKLQAEVFGRQYARGYVGGSFLSEENNDIIATDDVERISMHGGVL